MLVIVALWAANLHDEALEPAAEAASRFSPPSLEAMQGNGYLLTLGLTAPDGADPLEFGRNEYQARMRNYDVYVRDGKIPEISPDGESADSRRRIEPKELKCGADEGDCFAHYLRNAAAIRSNLARHEALVDRYLGLSEVATYEEIIPPYVYFASSYMGLVVASELVGMRATLLMQEDRGAALALLSRNATIHHRLMEGSRTILGGMIALALQMRQQRLVSSMLVRMPEIAREDRSLLESLVWRQPRVAPMFKGEVRWTMASALPLLRDGRLENSFDPEESNPDLMSRIVRFAIRNTGLLTGATLNELWRDRSAVVSLAQAPAHELDARVADLRGNRHAGGGPVAKAGLLDARRVLGLRNPWGNLIVNSVETPDWVLPYIERTHDVEGHRRLVLLLIEALRNGVTDAQMGAWLAAQPVELRNPYTRQAMKWDPVSRALQFSGRQPQSQNRDRSSVYRVSLPALAGSAR